MITTTKLIMTITSIIAVINTIDVRRYQVLEINYVTYCDVIYFFICLLNDISDGSVFM